MIADADSKKIVKNLGTDEYSLSNLEWSPDGRKLCFRAQSQEYAKYSIPGEEFSDKVSDKLGLYYANDNSVKYMSITGFLVYRFMWNSDSSSIALSTVPIKAADELVNKDEVVYHMDSPYWVDIKTVNPENLEVKDVLSSYSADGKANVVGLRSFSGKELFFVRDKEGTGYVSIMNIDDNTFKDVMPAGPGLDPIIYTDGCTFILDLEWLYRLDDGYKPVKLWERTIDGNISNDITVYPEINKIAYTRYDDDKKNIYLGISNLNY